MSYLTYTFIVGCAVAIAAISYQMVLSAGIMQACQAALVGIGAYASAVMTTKYDVPFLLAILGGGLITAAIGLPLSILALRLGHFFLAVATLGFAQIVIVVILNSPYLGEAVGLEGLPLATRPAIVLPTLALVLLFAMRLQNARLGQSGRALADDEIAASAIGINVNLERVRMFVVSAGIGGVAGGLLAHLAGLVVPSDLGFIQTVNYMIMVVLGGITTPLGAVLGAGLLTAFPEVLSFSTSYRLLLYGSIVILMMIFRPKGILHRRRTKSADDSVLTAALDIARAVPLLQALVPARAERSPDLGLLPFLRVESADAATRIRPAEKLEARGIAKSFGGLHVLEDISVDVARGEVLGIIGPNGAGKTTLFNILSGLETADGGDILLDGTSIRGLPPHRRVEKGIARTFQNIRVFPGMTVLENVMVARHCRTTSKMLHTALMLPRERRERRETAEYAEALLEWVGLTPERGRIATELAYGKQRRLEIARALATEPRFLLLDEPSAGMNTDEQSELEVAIGAVRDVGIGIVLIEHNVRLVSDLCDRMSVLNAGQVLATGDADSCLQHPDVIEAYLGAPLAVL
jgi:branched-chain amino acid transport system permease protein